MFTNDPKFNPRLPSPTSFDGVKPSYVEWSEELLTCLSVTDNQKFVPILQAFTGHKDVITKKVFIEGVLSEFKDQIKNKETEKTGHLSDVEDAVDQNQVDAVQVEIDALNEKIQGFNTHESRQFSQACSASLNIRRSQHHGSSHHENV